METWRQVEVAACEAMEGPSDAEFDAIRAATFTVEAVQERERVTNHDVAAFVDVLNESADAGRWTHCGLTSRDVLDTATAFTAATTSKANGSFKFKRTKAMRGRRVRVTVSARRRPTLICAAGASRSVRLPKR